MGRPCGDWNACVRQYASSCDEGAEARTFVVWFGSASVELDKSRINDKVEDPAGWLVVILGTPESPHGTSGLPGLFVNSHSSTSARINSLMMGSSVVLGI